MDYPWFKKWEWIYRPNSIAGRLFGGLCLFLIVWAFMVVDLGSHSVSDTLIEMVPWTSISLAILLRTASGTAPGGEGGLCRL